MTANSIDPENIDLVICSGMPRSASTWSFNVARRLIGVKARQSGWIKESAYADEDEVWDLIAQRKDQPPRHLVIKGHRVSQKTLTAIATGTAKNIYTYRDPRDAVASRRKFSKESFEQSLAMILESLVLYDILASQGGSLFVSYEAVQRDPRTSIAAMASYLASPAGPAEIEAINQATGPQAIQAIADTLKSRPPETLTKVGDHLVDPATQVHHNHIQGGEIGRFRHELEPDQQQHLARAFAPWLERLGYET